MLKLAEEKKTVTTFLKASRRKENSHHLANFIDFFNIHDRFRVLVNKLINIATGVIKSDDINVDLAVDLKTNIFSGLDGKNQAKPFATIRRPVKVGETVVQMSSDQLSQRLLVSVV